MTPPDSYCVQTAFAMRSLLYNSKSKTVGIKIIHQNQAKKRVTGKSDVMEALELGCNGSRL